MPTLKWVYRTDVTAVSPVRPGLLACVAPPFSPVSEPRLEWNVGLFSLDPDVAPCRSTRETSAEDNLTVAVIASETYQYFKHYMIILLLNKQTAHHIHMTLDKKRHTNKYLTTN